MKLAIAVWQDRVAPVFDCCRRILLLDIKNEGVSIRSSIGVTQCLNKKIAQLVNMDVTILICGAISQSSKEELERKNIQVIPFVVGDIEDVFSAWKHGSILNESFRMPGFPCKKRRCRRGRTDKH